MPVIFDVLNAKEINLADGGTINGIDLANGAVSVNYTEAYFGKIKTFRNY